jgi:endonuclease G
LLTHDCSTLGGASGSLVVDVATGHAIGLHCSGSSRKNNYAVQAAEIRKVLSRLNVRLTVPIQPPRAPAVIATASAGELSSRIGYQSGFLGSPSAFRVPLPRLRRSIAGDLAPVRGRQDGILHYTHFSIAVNARRRMAFYAACNIDGKTSLNLRRSRDRWTLDPRLDRAHQAGDELYRQNDLDRGHLVRRLDPVWGDPEEAQRANEDTFFYTNAAPQHARLNQGHWNDLEDYILNNANALDLRVSVFTGPVFLEDDPDYQGFRLPQRFWKVVVVVNGETHKLHATAYMLSQRDLLTGIEFVFGQFRTYQVPISEVERQTHLRFDKLRRYDPLKDRETFAIREITSLRDIVLS